MGVHTCACVCMCVRAQWQSDPIDLVDTAKRKSSSSLEFDYAKQGVRQLFKSSQKQDNGCLKTERKLLFLIIYYN